MADEAPPMPTPEGTRPATARTLGGFAQFGALGVGILYTIGVLIVNLNLGQYGVMSLDLARPEYVMAGLLWLFLTSVAVWSVHSGITQVKRHWTARRRWLHVIFDGFAVLVIPAGTLVGLGYRPVKDAPDWVMFAGGLLVTGTGAWLYAVVGVGRVVTKNSSASVGVSSMKNLQAVVNAVTLSLVALGLYAAVIYPDLPREYGGGRRPTVEIVLSELPPIDWKSAGVGFRPEEKTIGPVMVLLDTPGSLIVIRPETWKDRGFFRFATTARVLSLDRKLVSAVVYLPKETRE